MIQKRAHRESKEIEFKWQAHSIHDFQKLLYIAEAHGATIFHCKKRAAIDIYIDTKERFFERVDLACRIRVRTGYAELTVKGIKSEGKMLFVRTEKTLHLAVDSLDDALKYCQNHVSHTIRPLFEIAKTRQACIMSLPCETLAEACYDQVVMLGEDKQYRTQEVELEFLQGDVASFTAFVCVLPLDLRHSEHSKFATALRHVGADAPHVPIENLQDIATQVIHTNLKKWLRAVHRNHDAKSVHEMRVALRKLRIAIETFAMVVPDHAQKIGTMIKKAVQLLGQLRDCDIFLAVIADTHAFAKFTKKRRALKKAIAKRIKAIAARILALHEIKIKKSKRDSFVASRNMIQNALDGVLNKPLLVDTDIDDKTLHRLRISLKKLRYICEFFNPLYSKYVFSLRPLIANTKKLQDILGEHQDAAMCLAMLDQYEDEFAAHELAALKRKLEQRQKSSRKKLVKRWRNFWMGPGFANPSPTNPAQLLWD